MRARILGSVSIAQHVHLLAKEYGICAVLHTDHCNKKLLPWVDGLLDEGEKYFKANGRPLYTSHMIDLSEESLEGQRCYQRQISGTHGSNGHEP